MRSITTTIVGAHLVAVVGGIIGVKWFTLDARMMVLDQLPVPLKRSVVCWLTGFCDAFQFR